MSLTIPKDDLLAHALLGLEARREEITRAIEILQTRLEGIDSAVSASADAGGALSPGPAKRQLSRQARARISRATKRRWALYRAAKRADGR